LWSSRLDSGSCILVRVEYRLLPICQIGFLLFFISCSSRNVSRLRYNKNSERSFISANTAGRCRSLRSGLTTHLDDHLSTLYRHFHPSVQNFPHPGRQRRSRCLRIWSRIFHPIQSFNRLPDQYLRAGISTDGMARPVQPKKTMAAHNPPLCV